MKLENANLLNKRVIIRTDYNVPIIDQKIQSTKRIDASLETIRFVLQQNPKQLILISHLGRPKNNTECSLEIVREYLEKILEQSVILSKTFGLNENDKIVILENIRHHKEETEDIETTTEFREKLTSLCDVYINDAFGCSHRAHSSIVGINPPEKYLGFLVEKEVRYLGDIFSSDGIKTLLLGGSKVVDKIALINNLIPKFDNILIGGGMAFTFLKYLGYDIGNSLFDEEGSEKIPDIIKTAKENKANIFLPVDAVFSTEFSNNGNIKEEKLQQKGNLEGWMGLDIGFQTTINYNKVLDKSDIIVWNGPMGVFEMSNFENGSRNIMNFLANKQGITTIIGGGDTASCCEKFDLESKMTHVSTGGGASLELLEGKKLPGIF
jgi:phosphoglycerate kinase